MQTNERNGRERRVAERRARDRGEADRRRTHREPVSETPAIRPVGLGLGAVVGGAPAGVAAGTVPGGPIGTVAGAAAAMAGERVAESTVDVTAEERYWNEHYKQEPYYEPGLDYEDYAPAYRTGYEGRVRYPGRSFEEAERELETDYYEHRGTRGFPWEKARAAARAAWVRVGGR